MIFQHIWILFIVVTIANGFILKFRSEKYIAEKPELQEGYDKYFRGILFYGNIPWVIIAVGNLSGMTYSTFEYFNPKVMNPIVLIFHVSIIVLWVLSAKWIYFNNGAEFIEKHPGLMKVGLNGKSNITSKQIKAFFPLILLGGIVGMAMMWVKGIPVPLF